jgi:hypothetical protein
MATTFVIDNCMISIYGDNAIPLLAKFAKHICNKSDESYEYDKTLSIGNSRINLKWNNTIPDIATVILESLRLLEETEQQIDDDISTIQLKLIFMKSKYPTIFSHNSEFIAKIIVDKCKVDHLIESIKIPETLNYIYATFVVTLGSKGIALYSNIDNKVKATNHLKRIIIGRIRNYLKRLDISDEYTLYTIAKHSRYSLRDFTNEQMIELRDRLESYYHHNSDIIFTNITIDEERNIIKTWIPKSISSDNVSRIIYNIAKKIQHPPETI